MNEITSRDLKCEKIREGDLSGCRFNDDRLDWTGVNDEPEWFTVLAEWSVRQPSWWQIRKAYRGGQFLIWLRSLYHVYNDLRRRIKELEEAQR